MSHTPHELAEEFPEYTQALHELREKEAHFAKLADDYHNLNRAIHRAEIDIEPTDDLHLTQMRKDRLALKDQIFQSLTQGTVG